MNAAPAATCERPHKSAVHLLLARWPSPGYLVCMNAAATLPDFDQITLAADVVGERRLFGRFGGAVCHHYEIIAIDPERRLTTFTPCYSRSVRNDDGTCSTVWHRGTDPERKYV